MPDFFFCNRCGRQYERTPENFRADARLKSGLSRVCVNCHALIKTNKKKRAARLRHSPGSKPKYNRIKAKRERCLERAKALWGEASYWNCRVMGCLNKAVHYQHICFDLPKDVLPLCQEHVSQLLEFRSSYHSMKRKELKQNQKQEAEDPNDPPAS